MEKENANPLPKKLPGAICAQMVRCGKPTCKCALGELHGPYYYRFVWVNGRQRKEYVPQNRVSEMRAACAAHRAAIQEERALCLRNRQSWRNLIANLRELEKMIVLLQKE
ncbi:MAG: hypothetical protein HONDAALG_00734 [Gammaproteobacteria bacterium]|nr:hypothetical protein [Gammaproteobacteria bacterium]